MKVFISRKWSAVAALTCLAILTGFYAFDKLDILFLELTPVLVAAVIIPVSYHDCGIVYRGVSRADKDTLAEGLRLSLSCMPAFAVFLLIFWLAIRFKYL